MAGTESEGGLASEHRLVAGKPCQITEYEWDVYGMSAWSRDAGQALERKTLT